MANATLQKKGPAGTGSAAPKRPINRKYGEWAWGYFFVLPTIIGLVILNIYPIFQTLLMSFSKSAQFGRYTVSGPQNYEKLLTDSEVWEGVRNTLVFAFTSVPIGLIIAIILASFLSQKIRGVGAYRVIYFMPVVAAPAAVSMVWRLMYNSDYGVFNQVIRALGGSGIQWLSDNRFAMMSVVIVAIWTRLGQQIIIMIGAITNVSRTYYEAADIDGAGPLRKLVSITVPLVSPSIFFLMITGFIDALKQFDIVYMLYHKRTAPGLSAVRTIIHKYYMEAFDTLDKAYASSIVIVAFLIIMVFTIIQFVAQKKWVHYDN